MRNLPHGFDIYFSKRQNHEDDFANFCGLLRKAELYKCDLLNEKEIDVIQHPSSRPPLLFPCRAYNFGSQAASVVTTKVFCKNEIGTEKKPELLVTLIKRGVNFQHYCYLWPSFFFVSIISLSDLSIFLPKT